MEVFVVLGVLCTSLFTPTLAVPCNITCKLPVSTPTFFSTPTDGVLTTLTHKCVIPAQTLEHHACEVDVDTCIPFSELGHDTAMINYIAINCENRTRISITNKKGIQTKLGIGYLSIHMCDIYWTDIAKYAESVDLRVLYFQSVQQRFEEEETSFREMATIYVDSINELPVSLQNIGSLVIIDDPTDHVRRIFTDYLWPSMAEVSFFNNSLVSIPDALIQSMPNLQALELPFNNFTVPPRQFPWDKDWLSLPGNLSRTTNGNQHYSLSQGFETPPHLYRRILQVTHSKLSQLEDFHGCLQKIEVSFNAINAFTSDTFNSVKCLQNLDISHNQIEEIPEFAFRNLTQLTTLDLSFNKITGHLNSSHFEGLFSLQKLDISNNLIMSLGDTVFHPLELVSKINLAHNRLEQIPNSAVIYDANKLVKVDFKNNFLTRVPHFAFLVRSLLEVDLSHNQMNFESFLQSLKNLDIDHLQFNNRWSASQFGLPRRPVIKTITMKNNNFTSLDVSKLSKADDKMIEFILLFFDLDLNDNNLICDCKMYSMYRYLWQKSKEAKEKDTDHNDYGIDNWRCTAPSYVENQLISQVPNITFKCAAEFAECPSKCICLERSVDRVVEVDCTHQNLTDLPEHLPSNSRTLNMAYNSIKELNSLPAYLGNLTSINLSFNNISHIGDDFLLSLDETVRLSLHHNKLKEFPDIFQTLSFGSVALRSNPWICDCNTVWFKQWLLINRQSVRDLDEVTCGTGSGQGIVMIEVPASDFICEVPTSVVIAKASIGFLVTLIVIIILFLVMYKYRGEIRIFLYVHFKWHPFDRSENTDLDFDYDAFISYAGDDYKWVVYQLVARLEGNHPPFKLCLHDRDFEIGAPIQHNIMHSVKQSRRMIMVLTHKYLQSEWCMLEFRAAHERVLNDRSNYLILVLHDDIDINSLEDDMKLYIRTNTYLSVSNKWFWEKLLYAMPKEALCTLRDDIRFDFPYLTAPPKSYPSYLMGYMAKNKMMADRAELTFVSEEEDPDSPISPSTDMPMVSLNNNA